MSSFSEKINIWVPATVVGLGITLLGACIWDLSKRRIWIILARFFPCIRTEVRLDQDILWRNNSVLYPPNRNSVEQGDLVSRQSLQEHMTPLIMSGQVISSGIDQPGGHSSLNEEPASSSDVNTIGPTHDVIIDISENQHDSEERVSLMDSTSEYVEDNITFENSDTFGRDAPIRSFNIESNLEHVDATPSARSYNEEGLNYGSSGITFNIPLEPDNFPSAHMDSTPSSSSSSSMFTATLYLPSSVPNSMVRNAKKKLQSFAHRQIRQWKSSVVLQVALSTHSVVLAKIVKLLKDCVEVDKSCTLQLGTWGILYFKGATFTKLYTHV